MAAACASAPGTAPSSSGDGSRRGSPPHELADTWHLKHDPTDATDVRVCCVPVAERWTRVEIEQHGWEQLGSAAGALRARNVAGWETLLPHVVRAIDQEDI